MNFQTNIHNGHELDNPLIEGISGVLELVRKRNKIRPNRHFSLSHPKNSLACFNFRRKQNEVKLLHLKSEKAD